MILWLPLSSILNESISLLLIFIYLKWSMLFYIKKITCPHSLSDSYSLCVSKILLRKKKKKKQGKIHFDKIDISRSE